MHGSETGRMKVDYELKLEKIWWDCVKDDMESLGLPQKNASVQE